MKPQDVNNPDGKGGRNAVSLKNFWIPHLILWKSVIQLMELQKWAFTCVSSPSLLA